MTTSDCKELWICKKFLSRVIYVFVVKKKKICIYKLLLVNTICVPIISLGIQAPATNGSLDVFRSYLYNPPSHTAQVFKQAIDYIQQKENLPKGNFGEIRTYFSVHSNTPYLYVRELESVLG